jgi:signal peptidase I
MPRWRRLPPFVREVAKLALLVVVVLTGRATLADQYSVPSGSMEPTVQVGDRVLVNKAAYGLRVPFTERYLVRFAPPARGDVVVLFSPESGDVLLKRVAAVPGDRVQLHGREVVVPADRYLVLGDNRESSHDGRAFGLVDRRAILGHVKGVFWRDGAPTWQGLATRPRP